MTAATIGFSAGAYPDTDFFRVHRNAHRVFLGPRRGINLFNPFRHIPWGYEGLEADEAGHERIPRPEHETKHLRIGCFHKTYRWPDPRRPLGLWNQFARTLLTSWINIFLICVPIGMCLQYTLGECVETFAFNYLAEFPLWFLCDYGLEEMEKYIGQTTSDLLDIFTTNTVQRISSILLLKAKKVSFLQTYLVGSILSNILFLLGLSYFLGGLKNNVQRFNSTGAQGSSSLLSIAATCLLVPTSVKLLKETSSRDLVLQSRGVVIILLVVYISYIFTLMRTHRDEYRGSEGHDHRSIHRTDPPASSRTSRAPPRYHNPPDSRDGTELDDQGGTQISRPDSQHISSEQAFDKSEEVQEITGVHLKLEVATFMFVASVIGLYFCINATVESFSALTERTTLSQTFIALILLPIPNCDFAPISLAMDDFVEQTMKYTVGRSIQTALLVEPFVILIGWWFHITDVTLAFEGFEVVSLLTTILLLNFLIIPARVHWVHGFLLLADFSLIGVAAYFVRRPKV